MNIVRLQGQCANQLGAYYEFDRDSTPIGEGGMGVLYLGARIHMATGVRTPVVIKSIRDELSTQPSLIQRAAREASVQIDNENLIRMYDFVSNYEIYPQTGTTIIRYYIVMEYLVGINLDKVLRGETVNQNGVYVPLAKQLLDLANTDRISLCVMLMKDLLSGVLALHNAGYIHRDLDPSNVMITVDGKIKIIDFGICKPLNGGAAQQLTSAGAFMGKVHYASPELILGNIQNHDYTTDLYAMGIVLFQLYCGHVPLQDLPDVDVMQMHLKGKLPYKEIDNSDLQKIVRKATEIKQSKRYVSAAEFIVAIERLAPKRVSVPPVKASNPPISHPSVSNPPISHPSISNPPVLPQSPIPQRPIPQPPVQQPDILPSQPSEQVSVQAVPQPVSNPPVSTSGTVSDGPSSWEQTGTPTQPKTFTLRPWMYGAAAAAGIVVGVVLGLI